MLNIKTKAVAETGVLELVDADDEPLFDEKGNRCTITLYSPGSKVYEEADNERQNRLLEIMQRRPGKTKVSAEDRRQMNATFFARVTASFDHWTYDPKLSGFEMLKAAYMDPSIGFIVRQVDLHLGDWGNFKQGSAES